MNKQDKILKIKEIFVVTPTIQKLIDTVEEARDLSILYNYQHLPDCVFVTGETGVGKTTLIDKYMVENMPYDVEYGNGEGEKTIVPVLRCELPKAKHPKPVVSELLSELGAPENSIKGDVRQLTKRLVEQLKSAKVELIIIDEFQHAIETTNKNVIQEIGEWFKILLNQAKIPIVFIGVPWSYPVLEVNPQLKRRVRKRHFQMPNYTLETFGEFQQFIRSVTEQLPVDVYDPLESSLNAFRLFAASKGNLSELMEGIIIPASIKAVKRGDDLITEDDLINAVEENTDYFRENNPLTMTIDDIKAEQQIETSRWNPMAKKQQERVIPPEYALVKFSDLKLRDVLSKR